MDIYQFMIEYSLIWTKRETIMVLLIFSVLSIFLLLLYKAGKVKIFQIIAAFALSLILVLIFTSTVFGRASLERKYQLIPFWSYGEIFSENMEILKEVLLNIVLLLPVGIFLPIIFDKPLSWKLGLVIGAFISSVIEVLQLITCRGLFEFDDIFHNSLGCVIGCVLGSIAMRLVQGKKAEQ